jgi:hypothetical protein
MTETIEFISLLLSEITPSLSFISRSVSSEELRTVGKLLLPGISFSSP